MPTDYDNRRDIDLLIVRDGDRPALFSNLRDGTFRDVAQDVGPAAGVAVHGGRGRPTSTRTGRPTFSSAAPARPGVFAISTGSARFVVADAPAGTSDATSAQFVDYDNDGVARSARDDGHGGAAAVAKYRHRVG